MNWFKKFFTSNENVYPEIQDSVDLIKSISSMSFIEARDAAFKILEDPEIFNCRNANHVDKTRIPKDYLDFFCKGNSYECKHQDLIIDFLGRPDWLPDDRLPGNQIIGFMGEAGYITCNRNDGIIIKLVDTSFDEVSEEVPNLYYLILTEIAQVSSKDVWKAINNSSNP